MALSAFAATFAEGIGILLATHENQHPKWIKIADNNHMTLELYENRGGHEKKTMEIDYTKTSQETKGGEILNNWARILKVRLTEPRRVRIPMLVEKESQADCWVFSIRREARV